MDCHILVAEDEVDTADSWKLLLSISGFCHIHIAHDGEEAIALMCRFPINVDIAMPRINGIEVAKCLRDKPMILVIGISGCIQNDLIKKALETMHFFFVKPTNPENVIKLIKEYCF